MGFDSNRNFNASTESAADVGAYTLTLKSYFTKTMPYYATSTFTVTVIHYCMRSSVSPMSVPDQVYYVSDSALSIPFPQFVASIADCAPILMSAQLQSGASLPKFMRATSAGIIVSTPNPSDAKTYPVQVSTNPPFGCEPSTSTLYVNFNINVKCSPKKISPGSTAESYSFTMGSYTPLTIAYEPFTVTPACSGTPPTYDVALSNGSPLPSYMLADIVANTITVVDDGTLKVG